MIANSRSLWIMCLVFGIMCLGEEVFSQTSRGKDLTRDDIVINRNKPSIYMCVDTKLIKVKDGSDTEDLWLRVYNNTIWTISFRAEKMGTLLKTLKLSNGLIIAALSNKSIAFPRYQFESKRVRGEITGPVWGDVGTGSWLPSNTSASFKVPVKYLKSNALFLEYKYEWEFIGSLGQESNSPIHRVYSPINDISDISGNSCY